MSAPQTSGVPPLDLTQGLSMEEIGAANRRAQIDGVAAGTCAGFLGGFISSKMLRQSRNLGLLSGILTGSIVGYLFTQESLKLNLAKARSSHQELSAHLGTLKAEEESRIPPETWDNTRGERGVNGLEGLEDRYATTRGDH
ncbi:hypothetical protein JCM10213_005971 [Rhodosporidiobolus nylandii]